MFDDIITGIRYVLGFVTKATERKGPARIGEVREWKVGKVKKHGEHDWRLVADGKPVMPREYKTHELDMGHVEGEHGRAAESVQRHGATAALAHHMGRAAQVAEGLNDPEVAERMAAAYLHAGNKPAARVFMARAIELGGKTVGAESGGTMTREALAHADDQAKKLGLGTERRQQVREGLRARIEEHKKPEAKPSMPAAAMQSQLGAAAHSQPSPAEAKEVKQARRAHVIDAMKKSGAKKAHVTEAAGAEHRRLSADEHRRIAEAKAKGDSVGAEGVRNERRNRMIREKRLQRQVAAKQAAGKAVAAGSPVTAQVPEPVKDRPRRADPGPRMEPVKSPQVTPSRGTSKDTPKTAGTKPPEWVAKSERLEQANAAAVGVWDRNMKARQRKNHNVNAAFINELVNGQKIVFKPERMGPKPSDSGMGRAGFYDESVSDSVREKAAYELDRVLGIGLVPPTIIREDTVPGGLLLGVSQRHLENAGYKGGDHKTRGSAMHFVRGSKPWYGHDLYLQAMSDFAGLPHNIKRDLQRMAVFDYISGNGDRHQNNLMVDPKGNLVAIDHGLCFPWAQNPGKVGRRGVDLLDDVDWHEGGGFRSEPWRSLVDRGGRVDQDILDHLKTVTKDQVIGIMGAQGMKKEGEHCWMRLQALLKAGRLSDSLRKTRNWYKPEVLHG